MDSYVCGMQIGESWTVDNCTMCKCQSASRIECKAEECVRIDCPTGYIAIKPQDKCCEECGM